VVGAATLASGSFILVSLATSRTLMFLGVVCASLSSGLGRRFEYYLPVISKAFLILRAVFRMRNWIWTRMYRYPHSNGHLDPNKGKTYPNDIYRYIIRHKKYLKQQLVHKCVIVTLFSLKVYVYLF
jgi:hypothetical protein